MVISCDLNVCAFAVPCSEIASANIVFVSSVGLHVRLVVCSVFEF